MTQATENFYLHCNEEWINKNEIPAGYSRWSRFNELSDKTLEQLHNLLDSIEDERLKKYVKMFKTFDEKNELKFLKNLDDEIKQVNDFEGLINLYQSKLYLYGVRFLYSLDVESDFKNSSFNILYLEPSGLTLPGRDYYLQEQFKERRTDYLNFIKQFSDYSDLKLKPEDILDFETKLAELHLKPEDKRNPDNIYHPRTFEEIRDKYKVGIVKYFKQIGVVPDKIICTNPKYFENYLSKIDFNLLKNYLRFKLWVSFGSKCKGKIYDIIFNFFGKKLSGKKEPLPEWKRLLGLIDSSLGEVLGKEYVKKYFSEESKRQVDEMIRYFKETLNQMIKKSDWMEESTKGKALEKLEKINWKIGYPKEFEDFENLSIIELDRFLEIYARINEWWFYRNARDIYQLVDTNKWEMYPHQVNAYYHPLLNEIVFPAAILQPPFFSLDYSIPQNYGGIGVVIAHEITHGFDDQGKRFDADGNLNNWWSDKDEEKFKIESDKLVNQFEQLELYGTRLNGKLTLGENLADLGGVRISLASLKRKLGNLNEKQLMEFFESFAKIWANLCTKEEGQKLIKTDPHSPGVYRVNGILPHMDEFHQLYKIQSSMKMYLPNDSRCKIWTI